MKTLLTIVLISVALAASASSQTCALQAKEVKPALPAETQKQYERNLAAAFEEAAKKNQDADSTIWLGRRIAYLGNYRDAIRQYTAGIARFPNDARLYRHRGHRFITLRCFDDAIADLKKAAALVEGRPDEIEPDGIPNARNTPTSTLQSNIWYHYALAYYLNGDFERAAGYFMHTFTISKSADMKVAAANWAYVSSRRATNINWEDFINKEIPDGLDVIENKDYYKLTKLYQGKLRADDLLREIKPGANSVSAASLLYGIANWMLINGERERARAIFERIVAGNQWASFGYIAAEADLVRIAAEPKR